MSEALSLMSCIDPEFLGGRGHSTTMDARQPSSGAQGVI